jgi:hypothetical protein
MSKLTKSMEISVKQITTGVVYQSTGNPNLIVKCTGIGQKPNQCRNI